MKKYLLLVICLFALLTTPCYAASSSSQIGQTADAAIASGFGYLTSIIVVNDGTNAVTIVAYDNASEASGNKLFTAVIFPASSTNRFGVLTFGPEECPFRNGIYVDITTSGTATYDVFYHR